MSSPIDNDPLAHPISDTLCHQIRSMRIHKQILSIVFIGHVDAGKSTIAGQILNQLGLIDTRTLEKYQKEAKEQNRETWYLSWAFDTNPEERSKGKTTEVGKASFELDNKKIIVLDAPGHKMYVQDMISGVGQADVAVLVVSARINEFEAGIRGGQTREHILLAKSSGITKIIVLVNKMDDVSVNFERKRFDEIRMKLNDFLGKIYKVSEIVYIPISGYLGYNVKERSKEILWYDGESFLEYLDKMEFAREDSDFLMFNINEKVKVMGATFFGGKIECGKLEKGKEVMILPLKQKTTVVSLLDEEDVEIQSALVGDNVKVKLKDFTDLVNEGYILCESSENKNLKVCSEFTCVLSILESNNIISVGYKSILHIKTEQKSCKIVEFRKKIGDKVVKKPFVRKGETVFAKIIVESPLVLYCGEDSNKIDSFALRDREMTVAIGKVRKIIEK